MNPTPLDTLDQAAHLLEMAHAQAALDLLEPFLRARPGHGPARLLQAQAMLQLNRPEQALEVLDIAELYARTDPEGPDAADLAELADFRSQVLGRLGRIDQAITAAEQALACRPDYLPARRRLAVLLHQTGRVERAISACKDWLDQEPDHRLALRTLAACYQAIDCPDKALAIYQRLDRLDGQERPEPAMAQLLHAAGRLAEAARVYDRLVETDRRRADWRLAAADVAAEMGDERQVLAHLQAVLQVHPHHAQALERAARWQMQAGRFDKAGRLWWRRWHSGQDRLGCLAGLLVCAAMAHRQRLFDRVLARLDRCPEAPARRQQVVADMWQQALPGRLLVDLFESRSAQSPQELLPNLLAEADQVIGQALQDHPDHADLHYHQGMARLGIGQTDRAARSFDRALRLNNGYLAAAVQRIELLILEDNIEAAEAVIEAVRRCRGSDDVLLDYELALVVLAEGPQAAVERLLSRCEQPDGRVALVEQVAAIVMRHDRALAEQWWACCRRRRPLSMLLRRRQAA